MAVYDVNSNALKCIKPIAHRGYSTTAPENTIPAYQLAVANGYKFAECDISLTSDGVLMLLHDSTIDRTSDGSGTLTSMTYAEVRQYDFGSWKSSEYTGTVIPTLDEFLTYCAQSGLYPYLELKQNGGYTEAQVCEVVDMVASHGLRGKVSYISFSSTYLGYIKSYDPTARLGYVQNSVTASVISTAQGLLTGSNKVFIISKSRTSSEIDLCKDANIPMGAWTFTSASDASGLDAYISSVMVNGGDPTALDSVQACADLDGNAMSYAYDINGVVL